MGNPNLVIGVDLNFPLGLSETWGPSTHVNPLSNFFSKKISDKKLMDINLINPRPTCRNRKTGEARVAKRLDRFLMREEVVAKILVFRH